SGGNRGGVFRCDAVVLAVQRRLFDNFLVQRLKGAKTHVEGDERLFGPRLAAAGQYFRREVKPGRRRRDGASFASENSLVAVAVGGGLRAAGNKRGGGGGRGVR